MQLLSRRLIYELQCLKYNVGVGIGDKDSQPLGDQSLVTPSFLSLPYCHDGCRDRAVVVVEQGRELLFRFPTTINQADNTSKSYDPPSDFHFFSLDF